MAIDIGPVLVEKPVVAHIPVKPTAPAAAAVAPVEVSEPESTADTHLVISPYTDYLHLLDLRTVSSQEQLLAHALIKMKSLREDYATAPYIETFNWDEVVEDLRERAKAIGLSWKEQSFYIVVFRSQVPPTTDYSNLGALDKAAHVEAVQSGGFLKYWFGVPDANGRNLATCVWTTKEAAVLGGVGPAHRRAAGAARHSYTEWHIERLNLVIKDNIDGWAIEEWVAK
ncbi:hypothetical protein V495_07370 [Pseudogymnoascus sp. VKM F-4514 (FW-929)]|nr:hypothetical protein V490_07840 [Pseudogymnoascus sp. VKM F-3557]KFY37096.1 hypothetical protein V495_07370 [Pseudogymnoascus sp. VKM F-4514 (FW-929)]KFY55657.1 hypothetical protein V497_06826 [Pseudogymnoascus sp. VKM F-4516 (FW-969)]